MKKAIGGYIKGRREYNECVTIYDNLLTDNCVVAWKFHDHWNMQTDSYLLVEKKSKNDVYVVKSDRMSLKYRGDHLLLKSKSIF